MSPDISERLLEQQSTAGATLKSCPFCFKFEARPKWTSNRHVHMECGHCGAHSKTAGTIEGAEANWQRLVRAPEAGHE